MMASETLGPEDPLAGVVLWDPADVLSYELQLKPLANWAGRAYGLAGPGTRYDEAPDAQERFREVRAIGSRGVAVVLRLVTTHRVEFFDVPHMAFVLNLGDRSVRLIPYLLHDDMPEAVAAMIGAHMLSDSERIER